MQIFITPDDNTWFILENLPNERWKDIEGYEGLYQISDYGRVKSLKKNIIIKPIKTKATNYRYVVSLSRNGIVKQTKVHRLVAKAFLPNPENKPEVNHKKPVTNEICDNRVTELEWATHTENMRWRVICNNQPKNTFIKNNKHVCNKCVVMLDLDKNYIKEFSSEKEASIYLNVHDSEISKSCHNKIQQTGGYMFMFKEDYEIWKTSGKK